MLFTAGTRLDANARIPVLEPLRAVIRAFLELLDGFDADECAWHVFLSFKLKRKKL